MNEAWTSLIIPIAMAVTTHRGLADPSFASRLGFDPILVRHPGQWYRYFTSVLVHTSWWSYAANALMIYWFGAPLESQFGPGGFLAIFLFSLGLGNWLQARLGPGRMIASVGSTAGTSGLMFCCLLVLYPHIRPFGLPGWLFTAVYLIIAYNRPQIGSVCLAILSTADLFGAAVGMAVGLALHPTIALTHPVHSTFMVAITTAFLWYQWRNPLHLPFRQVVRLPRFGGPPLRGPPEAEMATEEEVDRLLDKISKEGLQSLSPQERTFLERASKKRRG